MSKRSRVESPTRSSVTIPYTAGDCLVALATRVLLSTDTLLPKWPVTREVPPSERRERLVFDRDLVLRAGAIWTGRSPDKMQVGQLHGWMGTSLLPESVTRTTTDVSRRIRVNSVPICPECVRERPYAINVSWRIPIAPICEKHKVVLVDTCTRCGEPLRTLDLREGHARLKSFGAPGCDNCGGPLEKGVPADPDALSATEVVTYSLCWEELRGSETSRVPLDLAAVQDLVNLQLPRLGAVGRLKSLGAHSPGAVARVLPAAVAAISPTHAWSTPLDGVKPERLSKYLKGQTGANHPRVRGLVARHYYRDRNTPMTRYQMSHPVIWPTHFPVDMSPPVADHLLDLAIDLGWDPSTKDLLRWTALLTASVLVANYGRVKNTTAITSQEQVQLEQLLMAAYDRGIAEKLNEDALTMAFAFFSVNRTKPHWVAAHTRTS